MSCDVIELGLFYGTTWRETCPDSFVLLRAYSLWIESTPALSLHLNPIDLFSLYVLFSQYRSRNNTLGNCFFHISSYSRTYVRIVYEKTKVEFPWDLYSENKTYKLKRSITKWLRLKVIISARSRWSYEKRGLWTVYQCYNCFIYFSQQVKSLPFHIPEAWKRYPFRAEPPHIGHYRE